MISPNEVAKIELESSNEPYTEPVSSDRRVNLMQSDWHEVYLKEKIADVLDRDAKYPDFQLELDAIYDYAVSKGAKTPEDIMWEVRSLASKLGTPGLGESRIKWLHQYVYLLSESNSINRKIDEMEAMSE